jgi:hypothetical protein
LIGHRVAGQFVGDRQVIGISNVGCVHWNSTVKSAGSRSDRKRMGRSSNTALLNPIRAEFRVVPNHGAPIKLQIMGSGEQGVLLARNVSQTGIGVGIPHEFEGIDLEKGVDLVITLPGDRPFLARGIIKHHSQSGSTGQHFGVQFTQISGDHREKIREYVRAMAPL